MAVYSKYIVIYVIKKGLGGKSKKFINLIEESFTQIT